MNKRNFTNHSQSTSEGDMCDACEAEVESISFICGHKNCARCVREFFPRKISHSLCGCAVASCAFYFTEELFNESIQAVVPQAYAQLQHENQAPDFRVSTRDLARMMQNESFHTDLPAAFVIDRIALGGEGDAIDLEFLQSLKITHVLNVARQSKNYHCKQFVYINYELLDNEEQIVPLHSIVESIENVISNPSNVLFVHCLEGRSRSVCCIAAVLLKRGFTLQQALNLLKRARSIANPNAAFLKQLQQYQESLTQ